MAKNRILFVCILSIVLLFPGGAFAGALAPGDQVIAEASRYVGVKEATGNNDGPEVKKFLASVGLPEGYSWCAAFVHYILVSAGFPNTVTAWSPTAHNRANVVYASAEFQKEPKPGDVFTIYSVSKKRIAHAGFYYLRVNERMYKTIEGNTNNGGSFNGDGVYIRIRSFRQTFSITRWTNN